MLKSVLAFIVVLSLAGPALAEDVGPFSANTIMPGCRTLPMSDTYVSGFCAGVVAGLVYMRADRFCLPAEATFGQEIQVVMAYIDKHPEQMHLQFSQLAYVALKAAWPCNK